MNDDVDTDVERTIVSYKFGKDGQGICFVDLADEGLSIRFYGEKEQISIHVQTEKLFDFCDWLNKRLGLPTQQISADFINVIRGIGHQVGCSYIFRRDDRLTLKRGLKAIELAKEKIQDGSEADRAGDVSDKLFAIVKRGKLTFTELASNMMKKNCKNCDFWYSCKDWDHPGIEHMVAHGECKKAIVGHYDKLIRDDDNTLPMMVQDGEGSSWCELITHENHYCACWKLRRGKIT